MGTLRLTGPFWRLELTESDRKLLLAALDIARLALSGEAEKPGASVTIEKLYQDAAPPLPDELEDLARALGGGQAEQVG
jgi:hypothetical protein